MITGEQVRAARALARMEQTQLAIAADLSVATVKRLEQFRGAIQANTATEASIRKVFADAGVIFIDENGGGAGVRLRDRH
jgi:transcriptional regulator with XRE-family HTH domain